MIDTLPSSINSHMLIATGVMLAAYVLIFSEVMHRSAAAIIGAVVMIGVGEYFGFYSQQAAVLAIDGNTMFLLAGMMMLVMMLRPTGGFEYLAIVIAKAAGGRPIRLLIYLSLAVSVISMFLDNVTTMLIFAPLTVLITRLLHINPMPYLMAEAMLSNIGGTATLVGDPPNVMIGSAAGIDFLTFMTHMAPIIGVVWLCTVFLIVALFRRELRVDTLRHVDLDQDKAITDPAGLKRMLWVMALVIGLFFVHHWFHLFPGYVTFIAVALALALMRPAPEPLFGKLNWSVLVFFAGLFVIVGGVAGSGMLGYVGYQMSLVAGDPGRLLLTGLLIMWVAALLSAAVDNIPFTVTMIPVITGLQSAGVDVMPLWWALALGVGLGGNGSHIGATANVIAVAEAERSGDPRARITPVMWLRKGLPTMFFSLGIASVLYSAFFAWFA